MPARFCYKYINIWDAGCAHGPEPYSIAILLRENMTEFLFRNVRIYATDIDISNRFGRIIAEGVYPEHELKRIPPHIRAKYFRPTGRPSLYRLCDELRARIRFLKHDLLSLVPPRRGFNLIVCKNVLLHFRPTQRAEVIAMFHETLAEGGFLILEQTQELPSQSEELFERVSCRGQLFRKRSAVTSSCVSA